MEWIFFALIGPLFWTISNFIDKYSIEKLTKGIADYAFFGSIGSLIVITCLLLFFDINIPSLTVLLITMLGGFLLNYMYITYGITLSQADTSQVIPIFQIRAVIVLIIGALFFNEVLTVHQLLGFLIAFCGALLLSFDFTNVKRPKLNKWSLFAFISTCGFAAVVLINDFSVENLDIPSVIFFFDSGFLVASLSYLLYRPWRKQIIDGLQTATWKKFGLFTLNDLADEIAQMFSKVALSLAPAAALVPVVQGVQSFYVLLGGILLTLWFPRIVTEKIDRQSLVQRVIGIVVISIGISFLYIS